MGEPEFEKIGDWRFSILRPRTKKPELGLSWHLLVVATISVVIILIASKWAVVQTEKGNFLPMTLVAIFLFAGPYLLVLLGAATKNRKSKSAQPKHEAVVHIPPNSVQIVLRIVANDKRLCDSVGVLSTDNGLLRFRGERFNLDLKVQDFAPKAKFENLESGKLVRVLTPTTLPVRQLTILPTEPGKGKELFNPEASAKLHRIIESWRLAAVTTEPSLFPPLRKDEPYKPTKAFWGGLLLASVLLAGTGVLIILLFRESLKNPNPWVIPVALGTMPFLFAFAVSIEKLEAQSAAKKIEKLKASGKVQMR